MSAVSPSSDVSATGWVATPSGALYDAINEGSPSDADYIVTRVDDANVAIFGLDTPLPIGTHSVSIRSFTSYGTASLRLKLLDGSNNLLGASNYQTINSTPTTYSLPISISGTATRVAIELSNQLPTGVMMEGNDPLSWNGQFLSFSDGSGTYPEGVMRLGDDPVYLSTDAVSFA